MHAPAVTCWRPSRPPPIDRMGSVGRFDTVRRRDMRMSLGTNRASCPSHYVCASGRMHRMRVLWFALGFVVVGILWKVEVFWFALPFVVAGVVLGVLMNAGFATLQSIARQIKRTAHRSHA